MPAVPAGPLNDIVRLHVVESRYGLFLDQADQVGIESMFIFRIVQSQGDHTMPLSRTVAGEMTHGAEKTRHFLNVRPDDIRLLPDFHKCVTDVFAHLLEPAVLGKDSVIGNVRYYRAEN